MPQEPILESALEALFVITQRVSALGSASYRLCAPPFSPNPISGSLRLYPFSPAPGTPSPWDSDQPTKLRQDTLRSNSAKGPSELGGCRRFCGICTLFRAY